MKIKVEKELFQWEKDRKIIIETSPEDPVITILEFYNSGSRVGEAEVLENNEAFIPNHLLKTTKPLMVLACTGEIGNTQPIDRRQFRIIPRACPEGYDDSDTDIPPIPDWPVNTLIIFNGGEEIYGGNLQYQVSSSQRHS